MYSDADYAGDVETRKSIRMCDVFANGPILGAHKNKSVWYAQRSRSNISPHLMQHKKSCG